MNHKLDNTLFNKLKQKGFSPTHAAEVGVYYPETSNIYNFIVNDIRSTLIEPDPDSIKRIKEHFSDRKNIELHTVALCDFTGSLDLVQRGASTFSSTLSSSPSIINDGYTVQEGDKFTVEAYGPYDEDHQDNERPSYPSHRYPSSTASASHNEISSALQELSAQVRSKGYNQYARAHSTARLPCRSACERQVCSYAPTILFHISQPAHLSHIPEQPGTTCVEYRLE